MLDPRVEKAARVLVDYSSRVKKGDRVIISTQFDASPLALAVYKLCLQRGAYPVIRCGIHDANYLFFKYASDDQIKRFPKVAMYEVKNTDVFINLFADYNTREMTNIDPAKIALRSKVLNPISRWRCDKTRWVLFDYPTNASAQEAGMSLSEFEDFVFKAVDLDWPRFEKKLARLASFVNAAEHVRIVGKDTDIEMTIKGSNCVSGDGACNMPGGEIFTAPNKYSVKGHIKFDFPSIRYGNIIKGIYLEFEKGKVVKAEAEYGQDVLKAMLRTDEGASYLGELGIGCNYNITKHTNNTLFDEKIGGTIHLALGNAYPECNGKNKSALHWDLVKDLRTNGRMYLDGKLFQKNGKFLV